jgi:TRAP-type uncharacterized transport system fused permease subunit
MSSSHRFAADHQERMRGGQADVGREIKHAEDWTSAVPPRTLSGVTKGWAQEILGRRDAPAPRVSVFVGLVALAMTCLHVFQTQSFWFPTGQFKNIHVNLAAILVFLAAAEATPDARHWARRAFVAMAFVAALPLVYIHVEYQALVEERGFTVEEMRAWVRDGAHVNAVGAYRPDMREVDAGLLNRAVVVVDQREAALHEAGDLLIPAAQGEWSLDRIAAELADLVLGRVHVDRAHITLFKSCGLALEDIAAAQAVLVKLGL